MYIAGQTLGPYSSHGLAYAAIELLAGKGVLARVAFRPRDSHGRPVRNPFRVVVTMVGSGL